MSNLIVKQFQGSDVRFETREDGKIWGCLTDMAKVTDKQIGHYLVLDSTKELNEALGGNSLQSKKGRNGGTWGTEQVVIDFAIWCKLEFRLWVISAIQELITTGIATAQRSNESPEDYQKREQILKQENQRLLTENGYLQAWSPRMSLQKMRYLEMIGYTPSNHSPFLKPKEQLRDYYYTSQCDWDIREGRIVQDLVDTLFEPGLKISYCDYGLESIESLLQYLPSKFYSLSVNSPYQQARKPVPRKGFEQFANSIKVKHDNLWHIWLEFMPKKKDAVESYLNATEDFALV